MTIVTTPGIGERRLAENRARFRRLLWSGLLIGGGIGLAAGFLSGFTEGWRRAGGERLGWVVWPVMAAMVVIFVRYCRIYFRQIDELDLQDNLWSSLVGFYVAIALVPAWGLLHYFDQLPEPGPAAWIVWGVSACGSIAAYGWRKLRHRF